MQTNESPNSPNLEGAHGVVYFASPHLALIVLLCILTGMSLMGALWAIDSAQAAKEQARRSELRVEGFTRALVAHNIDPYPHIKGENP